QLLGERIADLHRRPTLLRVLVERRRGHGRAVNAVTTRLVADVEHGVAHALGPRAEETIRPHEPDTHHVDERVAVVFGPERDLTADRGASETVAVPADARDDAGDDV